MTSHTTFRTVAAAVATAIAFGAGAALAQPARGPHGPGGADAMIGHLIAHAKAALNLNTMQQGMFDAVVAASKTAREATRALHQKVKDAVQAELAKAEPDLAAVAVVADSAAEEGRALRKPIREQWLALYATFSSEQKAVVREMMQKRMGHAESFRQKMRERMHQLFDGAAG